MDSNIVDLSSKLCKSSSCSYSLSSSLSSSSPSLLLLSVHKNQSINSSNGNFYNISTNMTNDDNNGLFIKPKSLWSKMVGLKSKSLPTKSISDNNNNHNIKCKRNYFRKRRKFFYLSELNNSDKNPDWDCNFDHNLFVSSNLISQNNFYSSFNLNSFNSFEQILIDRQYETNKNDNYDHNENDNDHNHNENMNSINHTNLSQSITYTNSNTITTNQNVSSISLLPLTVNINPIISSSTSTSSTIPLEIDTILTRDKLHQLQHDVKKLETAIRHNLNEQKELNDRLFEQLAEIPKSDNNNIESPTDRPNLPFDHPSVSPENEIKRIYSEKLKILKKQSKTLNEQLQVTRFVIGQLEIHGIPVGVSPKDYVKQLLTTRNKSSSGSATTSSPVLKPKRTVVTTQSIIPSSSTDPENVKISTGRLSDHKLIAKTMPARISDPSTDLLYKPLPARQAHTMPASSSGFHGSTHPITILDSMHINRGLKPVASSGSLLTQMLNKIESTTQDSNSTTFTVPGDPLLPGSSLTSHSTIPHLFQAGHEPYHDQSVTTKSIAGTKVLNSMRMGLETFGRQLLRVGKNRSASDDNIPMEKPGRSNNGTLYTPHGSSHPSSSSKKGSRKKVVKSPLAGSNLLYPPDTSTMGAHENTAGKSQPFRTYSLSSTNGASGINQAGFDGGRSMISGISGAAASKDETNHCLAASTNSGALSLSEGDNSLALIFEFLGLSGNSALITQNIINSNTAAGGVGSSGSSALSAAGFGPSDKSKTGSKSHIAGTNVSITDGNVVNPISSASGLLPTVSSLSTVSANNLALAFTLLYRHHESQIASLNNQQIQSYQELRDELALMRIEASNIQTMLNNLTTELEAIRRDANTKAELQNQKLSDATARIERLDAAAEESRQTFKNELGLLGNKFHTALESVEYKVDTKTRYLDDNITTINNKVSIMEKPHDHTSSHGSSSSELDRIRHKILHYLLDLGVSLFALMTMLLQVLIRCLNLGAVLTENRTLAILFSMTLLAGFILVYISDPLLVWLNHNNSTVDNSNTITETRVWRNLIVAILSFFRGFSRNGVT